MRAPEFWISGGLAAGLLSPLGTFYGWSVAARQVWSRPFRSKARVICIGNLTAGGTGKTPVAIAIFHTLAATGGKIVFLSRGYGGRLHGPVEVDLARHSSTDVGDESLLLAAHGTTIVARDRAKGAQLADELGAAFIIMDDGFQNFQIAKDLAIVVVDASSGFGNGRLIPAGPLREPVTKGLSRADAIVLVGDGTSALPPFGGPILKVHIVAEDAQALRGRNVVAFAGIGRPKKFFDMLCTLGVQVTATRSYPDHHWFSASDLAELKETAKATNALLVTTEKDFARLDHAFRREVVPVPVRAEFADGAALRRLLDRVAEPGKVGSI